MGRKEESSEQMKGGRVEDGAERDSRVKVQGRSVYKGCKGKCTHPRPVSLRARHIRVHPTYAGRQFRIHKDDEEAADSGEAQDGSACVLRARAQGTCARREIGGKGDSPRVQGSRLLPPQLTESVKSISLGKDRGRNKHDNVFKSTRVGECDRFKSVSGLEDEKDGRIVWELTKGCRQKCNAKECARRRESLKTTPEGVVTGSSLTLVASKIPIPAQVSVAAVDGGGPPRVGLDEGKLRSPDLDSAQPHTFLVPNVDVALALLALALEFPKILHSPENQRLSNIL
ncbi:hypothetical protein DFH06DRAFT_1311657 [Mycena polygramma]|nr:hypothetical protein DFH06DRAFT_1311657 [Mycena polygramma]